jgi:hypothetical protein
MSDQAQTRRRAPSHVRRLVGERPGWVIIQHLPYQHRILPTALHPAFWGRILLGGLCLLGLAFAGYQIIEAILHGPDLTPSHYRLAFYVLLIDLFFALGVVLVTLPGPSMGQGRIAAMGHHGDRGPPWIEIAFEGWETPPSRRLPVPATVTFVVSETGWRRLHVGREVLVELSNLGPHFVTILARA